MYYFTNDYSEGAHPLIMQKLLETNMEQTDVYGSDQYCANAKALIKTACGREDADVHLFIGGTQTNFTIISAALRPFQGVYSSFLGHINTHEAGAIEHTGHKVLELPTADGKLTAQQVEENYLVYLNDPKREHWVQPKMVYISHPSEVGTLYTKKELEELSATCKKYGLYLFLDGARLGYGLMSPGTDLTLKDIARLCDVFYIGGTKCGALFGEAAVILNPDLKPDFHTIMKQSGAVLAKGRLLGLQFQTLFTDNLYEKICQHGINMAMLLKEAFAEKGLPFVAESFTNQQFPILTEKMYETLTKKYGIGSWEVFDNGTRAVRFCTSWATSEEQVHNLINDLKAL